MAAGRGSGLLTGAPAGRDTIEPLGLHMCGWAKDNHGCPWDSQTGYKITSRMQRRRRKPSVVRKETKETVARLSQDGLPEARLGRVGPPPKSLAVRTPMCASAGRAALPPQAGLL